MFNPVRVSVVGHTNTGKTSFLRTLLKDPHFGEVSSTPSTTRDVLMAELRAQHETIVQLFDTPGLEDSQALYEHLQGYMDDRHKHNGPALLELFLNAPEAKATFEQEAKVIRQLLNTDIALFVIDTRTPVLEKYLDELAILRLAAKPIIPVLNFLDAGRDLQPWQEALARVNLHNSVLFDTQSSSLADENRLLEQCIAAMPMAREPLLRLQQAREQEQAFKQSAAFQLLAELLVNVGAFQIAVDADNEIDLIEAQSAFKNTVIQAENQCLQDILGVFGFDLGDARLQQLPITEGSWQQHSFNADAWKKLGVEAGTGVVAGGTVGAGIDILTGGLSLGAGTVLGAMVGGLYQGSKKFSKKLQAKFTGKVLMQAESQVLDMLLKRQLLLIRALLHRGHAAIEPLQLELDNSLVISTDLRTKLRSLSQQPSWSQLGGGRGHSHDRAGFIKEVKVALDRMLSAK
ncbi:DUF3482 domain-containing protein [Aliidiomarina taiwanensis]|uniref:DUF3482 domain-containing protein n=1 Tax=Aliidiomarina taiwanensis TaxID=946228 RepID=A0A432X9R2_9GAMM|nr:DUF3482 domain-containing protein [Aliidiomarina taiwanensis]RUO44099.1 DUF3482 domain-containing protein [Aliidiomarina taiwanensis]